MNTVSISGELLYLSNFLTQSSLQISQSPPRKTAFVFNIYFYF